MRYEARSAAKERRRALELKKSMPIDKLITIMQRLRDPENGCPWDIKQNFKSIAPHTIEEAYEVVDAIENGNTNSLKEELGDLLLQVIFHSQLAEEEHFFSFNDVVEAICEKLIRRHPHVFGDENILNAEHQEKSWENIKKAERGSAGILDDIAITLPALTRSVKLQKRAAQVGFDWPDTEGAVNKLDEELKELKQAMKDNSNISEEIGDVLFSITNIARKLKVDPETALRECNHKFTQRFNYIEKSTNISEATLEEMEKLWQEAKKVLGDSSR